MWAIPFMTSVQTFITLTALANENISAGSELRFCANLAKCGMSQLEGKRGSRGKPKERSSMEAS